MGEAMTTRAALAAPLLLLAAGATAKASCPTVYEVAKVKDPSLAYNILFLGAGFKESELPAFREVVQELTAQVVERASFKPHGGCINVYRMDLVSESGVSAERCPQSCSEVKTLATPLHNQGGSEDLVTVDLVARRCWLPPDPPDGRGNCNLVWLDAADRAKVLELQFCAPNIHAVVVVANLNALVGGGLEDALSAGVGLTVIGSSPGKEDGYSLAGPWAAALLEHEFGHLFGLYDEYVAAAGAPRGEFHTDRNVWRPIAPDETQAVLADPTSDYDACKQWDPRTGKLAPLIPWQATLDEYCEGKGLAICEGTSGPCPGCCVWSPSEHACEVTEAAEAPGLWEGAYYSEGCFHRARYSCLMRVASPDETLCEACQGQIHRALSKLIPGASACGKQQVPPAEDQPIQQSPTAP